jgi:hypothetical protein
LRVQESSVKQLDNKWHKSQFIENVRRQGFNCKN